MAARRILNHNHGPLTVRCSKPISLREFCAARGPLPPLQHDAPARVPRDTVRSLANTVVLLQQVHDVGFCSQIEGDGGHAPGSDCHYSVRGAAR